MLFLQADEDLLPSEMDEIWDAVLKSSDDSSRADIDSFVQIYRDIDDLFEDEDEDVDGSINEPPITETPLVAVDDNGLDEELSNAFKSICDDSGLISKDKLKGWEEIELFGDFENDDRMQDQDEEENNDGDRPVPRKDFVDCSLFLSDLVPGEDGVRLLNHIHHNHLPR